MNYPKTKTKMQTRVIVTLLLLPIYMAVSGTRHTVLFEKFTNVGCAPCAIFAPQADSLLDVRFGEVVEITYHGNVPYPNEEFYLPVRDQVGARISHYGVYAYPTVVLDGAQCDARITDIDARLGWLQLSESPLRLTIKSETSNGSLSVSAETTSLEKIQASDLRLFVAAVEQEVRPERPAFNGQTVFHNEFRQFLTPSTGYPLKGLTTPGTSENWEGEWTIERMEDTNELAVVAWVQDMTSGKVLETVFNPRPAKSELGARVVRVADTPEEVCDPLFSGRLWLRNTGAENLTECNITIDIDGDIHTFPWRGDLPYLATEEVAIPPFTDFELHPDKSESAVTVGVSSINGKDITGEAFTVALPHTLTGHKGIKLLLSTDNKPQEISWQLLDANDRIIAESEPYTEMRHNYTTILPIENNGCYRIVFSDSGRDGISGKYGGGFYRLYETDGQNERGLVQSTYTGAEHTIQFRAADIKEAHVNTVTNSGRLMTYDASRHLITTVEGGSLTVYDMEGRVRMTIMIGPGEGIHTGNLGKGTYIVGFHNEEHNESLTIFID